MPNPILLIVIAALFFATYYFLTKDKKKLKRFRNEWETSEYPAFKEDFKTVSAYWTNKKNNTENYDGIDQLTWDDLSMDEVFKQLNYTQSTVGSEYLFNKLRDIHPELEKVEAEEELYMLLQENQKVREEVLLVLTSLGKRNHTNSSSFFYNLSDKKIAKEYIYTLLAFLPIMSVVLMFFSLNYGIFSFFSSLAINMFIYYRNKAALENELFTIAYAAAVITTGKRFAKLGQPEFREYAKKFTESVKPIRKISFFGTLLSSGQSGELDFVFDYIRMLFMLDFIAYNKIIKTISKNKEDYLRVWQLIGELDAAVAIAFYRESLDVYCKPKFTNDEAISFDEMVHPLIKNPISNTSTLGKNTLITGSNASGKSTYVKAVAINALLAQTINTVLATRWTMKPSYIVTSMAIQDSVLDGDSYFIAEIKSLKRIIKLIEEGKPCISFVDEILKGTNTVERIAASAAMMEWLSSNSGINIIASHDIELTEMARLVYANYHFRESIENGKVLFDYIIHPGPSTTRNAIKLLELLEYPELITKKANGLANQFSERREWKGIGEGVTVGKYR